MLENNIEECINMNQNIEPNDSEHNKIFVGNVPFQCTPEEFQNCFEKMNGFMSADIIRRYKSKLSRGFGFVIFADKDSADGLMNKTVFLRERKLRFSPYSFEYKSESKSEYSADSEQVAIVDPSKQMLQFRNMMAEEPYEIKGISMLHNQNNQIFIRNLDEKMKDDELKQHFKKFGEITSCFITSKSGSAYAVINFKDEAAYKAALNDEKEFEVYQYKKKKKVTNLAKDPSTVYREGFRAGQIVGYHSGFQDGMKQSERRSFTQN
jgi:RNA recognition motif-containing protein